MLTRRITPAFALGIPAFAFFAMLAVVQERDALRGLVQELVEPLVELAEVAEHERLHLAELKYFWPPPSVCSVSSLYEHFPLARRRAGARGSANGCDGHDRRGA